MMIQWILMKTATDYFANDDDRNNVGGCVEDQHDEKF